MRARRVAMTGSGLTALGVQEQEVGSPGPGELLLAADFTLISPGTELATVRGLTPFGRGTPERPAPIGYSVVGTVLEVGPGVTAWEPGQRLAGHGPHASHALIRADRPLTPLPEGVPVEQGAFASLLAIALNGVRLAHVQIGEGAAVVGQGLIGQLAAQLLRVAGARPVLALDALPSRLAVARETGTLHTLQVDDVSAPGEGALGALRELTGGEGPRVVIEATGAPAPVLAALRIAAHGGRVVLLGSTRGLVSEWDPYTDVHRKALTVIGAHSPMSHPPVATFWNPFTQERNMAVALDLVRDGSLRLAPLISDRFPGAEAPRAFAALAEDPAAHLGVLLDWRAPA